MPYKERKNLLKKMDDVFELIRLLHLESENLNEETLKTESKEKQLRISNAIMEEFFKTLTERVLCKYGFSYYEE